MHILFTITYNEHNLRKFTLISLLVFFGFGSFAQRKCGTAEVLAQKLLAQPKLVKKMEAIELDLQRKRPDNRLLRINPRINIPVVVHVVLSNPAQVTDQQIYDQLAALNLDYIATNTDINKVPAVWQAIIGNPEIQFCLAVRTPDGDPSSGITRTTTNHGAFSVDNSASDVKYPFSGGARGWDNTRYLNIWVCDLANDYLGVATPPGNIFPAAEDGVVVDFRAFGRTGTAQTPFNLGRTLTHEIGHFFGLKHVWADDNGGCTQDDGVSDTPLQGDHTYNCPTFPFTDNCSPAAPGIMFMNYMDYVNDACMYLFTSGQTDRMRNAIDAQRASLITSNGCTPVNLQTRDAGITAVSQPLGYLCEAGQTPVVTLKNRGSAALTSVTIRYTINGSAPVNYSWTGNLSSLQQTEVTLPALTAGQGTSTFKAYTLLPNGAADDQPGNDTAIVDYNYRSELSIPFKETFDNAAFPPEGFTIVNPDRSFTWEHAAVGSKGTPGSALMRNLGYARNNETDDLLGPVVDAANADSVFLTFDLAAAIASPAGSTGNPWDTLEVLLTTDCGKTFIPTGYKKWGAALATKPTPTTEEFIPIPGEWRTETVDLTPLVRNKKFRVAFRNTTNYENNVYIDEINITKKDVNSTLRDKGILIWPNPFSRQFFVEFSTWPEDLVGIAIFDAAGRLVYQQQPVTHVGNRVTIDLVNGANGVYFVKLFYTQQVRTYKIVKAK
ncbi:T9SS type A sorting domain-containing protein [Chitinophaga sp. SYP-B3965]|uniref:M43 family zinc metalloprotease n=1 Tax=Chitinophaga sp. SYP-B3965 TaxID=2663120 RepID=UPI001299B3F3|nr:M43 family zinc metalloprotease [Chitinophaga sp. SYP-B3965]MRG44893.1 T9SS type A sorting domain-containing protein [Chitinophaga sp. SYP-B3965]